VWLSNLGSDGEGAPPRSPRERDRCTGRASAPSDLEVPRGRTGRPPVGSRLSDLVRTMAIANPLWGAPRIHGELLKLGLEVSQRTLPDFMPRRPKPPSQTWPRSYRPPRRPCIRRLLCRAERGPSESFTCFVVLLHHRRQVVHFNVTESPTAALDGATNCRSVPQMTRRRAPTSRFETASTRRPEFRRRVKGMRKSPRSSRPTLPPGRTLRRARDRHPSAASSSTM